MQPTGKAAGQSRKAAKRLRKAANLGRKTAERARKAANRRRKAAGQARKTGKLARKVANRTRKTAKLVRKMIFREPKVAWKRARGPNAQAQRRRLATQDSQYRESPTVSLRSLERVVRCFRVVGAGGHVPVAPKQSDADRV